ncbi:hypothetical protein K438DRAFT_1780222 [Mycena galopus ATCC 62051]|nr:hypothetical protein K438DRAFT_1780222 [Mycena galopus ATCC 62051]
MHHRTSGSRLTKHTATPVSQRDPAHIPTLADLESLPSETKAHVAFIFDIKKLMSENYREPNDVGPTLWSRIWPWIFFMHEYREYLGTLSLFREQALGYTQFLLFVADIFDPIPMRGIISSTPGFRVVLTTTWTVLSTLPRDTYEHCLWFLSSIIGALDFIGPLHFSEMVDDAGGTLDDLAMLMMRHMDDVVNGQFSWKIGSLASYLRFLAELILAAASVSTVLHFPLPHLSTRQKFHETLRLNGFIPAFVIAMDTALEAFKSHPKWRIHDTRESSFIVTLKLFEHLLNTTMVACRHRDRPPPFYRTAFLRTDRPQVHDALCQLARSIPTGSQEEHISDEVESILENAVALLEIHKWD